MPVADILRLGAAGSAAGTYYFVATYKWTSVPNASNWGSIVYSATDNKVYSSVHNNGATQRELLITTDLTNGDCTAAYWYNGDSSFGSARNMKVGVSYNGQRTVLQFARYGQEAPRLYNIDSFTTIPKYYQDGYNYFYGINLANTIMGHQGRPYAFAAFVSYDTPSGYILMPYDTDNSTTNKLSRFSSSSMGWNDARLIGTDQVAVAGVANYNYPRVMKLTLNSADRILTQVGMEFTNMGTSYNNQYASVLAYRPTGNVTYIATYWGICPSNFTTMSAHATYPTGRQMPTNVPNPASAATNDAYYVRVSYDSVNDRIYLSKDHWAIALSPDLATIYWYITGAFTKTQVIPKGDADGNIIFSATSTTDTTKFVIAQLDKDASQVSTSYVTPIAGVSWRRGTSGVTMSASTVTVSSGTGSFTYINNGSLRLTTSVGLSSFPPSDEAVVGL